MLPEGRGRWRGRIRTFSTTGRTTTRACISTWDRPARGIVEARKKPLQLFARTAEYFADVVGTGPGYTSVLFRNGTAHMVARNPFGRRSRSGPVQAATFCWIAMPSKTRSCFLIGRPADTRSSGASTGAGSRGRSSAATGRDPARSVGRPLTRDWWNMAVALAGLESKRGRGGTRTSKSRNFNQGTRNPPRDLLPKWQGRGGLNHGGKSSNYLQDCTICVSCRWTGPCWNVPRKRENRFEWREFRVP